MPSNPVSGTYDCVALQLTPCQLFRHLFHATPSISTLIFQPVASTAGFWVHLGPLGGTTKSKRSNGITYWSWRKLECSFKGQHKWDVLLLEGTGGALLDEAL